MEDNPTRRRYHDLESFVAKLPVYADTGTAFAPWENDFYINATAFDQCRNQGNNWREWFGKREDGLWKYVFYSTPEAAQEAADAAKGGG